MYMPIRRGRNRVTTQKNHTKELCRVDCAWPNYDLSHATILHKRKLLFSE